MQIRKCSLVPVVLCQQDDLWLCVLVGFGPGPSITQGQRGELGGEETQSEAVQNMLRWMS